MDKEESGIFLACKGALIGTGAILPGVSGGVLCVALGVYRPLMALLAHPLTALRTRLWFYLPLLLGGVIGVLGLARGMTWLFRASPVPAVWLFVGLIAGTLPGLWREAGVQGRPVSAYVTGSCAFLLVLGGLLLLRSVKAVQLRPGTITWLLCGVLWGLGLVLPGLSPSSLFLYLGIYEPMTAGIAAVEPGVVLPMGAGLLACVLALSRAMETLLCRAYAPAMHMIFGVALASTLLILPLGQASGLRDTLVCALCFGAGLGLALWLERLGRRVRPSGG